MRRASAIILAAVLLGAALFFVLTIPQRLAPADIAPAGSGNAERGARIFWAGGCASCHAAPRQSPAAPPRLGGGAPLNTPFGRFQAPNISPHPVAGIGAWSLADFANAMQRGVDPEGRHLYPAFPYTSYARMTAADIADLFAFIRTLPPVATTAPPNDLAFPFNIRRGLGLWKRAFPITADPVIALPASAPAAALLGRYLVEGPGHCGECHTPRQFRGAGGLDKSRWLAGAPNPEGKGRTPNITPATAGIGAWSTSEIADYLETGFTPDYDSVGGAMAEVQRNMARLPAHDRAAIAAYLKAVPATPKP